MHARHYSPEFGRFLTPDPSALETNLYGYTENSPITKVDPLGKLFWFLAFAVVRIAVAVAPAAAAAVRVAPRVAPIVARTAPVAQRFAPTANALGQAGERAVRAVYNIGSRTSYTIAGRTRIPDGVTRRVLTEVKNVKYQSRTLQIRDGVQYAQSTERSFHLYVRSTTILSKPLQNLVSDGQITLRTIPGT